MFENLPCNAGDGGSIPGWGTRIPYSAEQLSLYATTAEPAHHNQRIYVLQGKIWHDTGKPNAAKQIQFLKRDANVDFLKNREINDLNPSSVSAGKKKISEIHYRVGKKKLD